MSFLTGNKRQQLREDYIAVFSTPVGQRVLRHICSKAFVLESTFVIGDPNATMLNEGSRRLALSIMRYVARNDQELQQKVEEYANTPNA